MTEISPSLQTALQNANAFAMANCIRALSIDGVEAAKSGHPGAPMGMAEAAVALWGRHMKFDAETPDWPDRDRLVLSNGHGSMLLYSLLYLTGFEDMTLDELKNFRQWASKTAGHPEYGHAKGIDTTTGPLGQGLAGAVGIAIAERSLAAAFGAEIVDHRTWVFCGDGCLMEGISQEAISLAGHLALDKLIGALRRQRHLDRRLDREGVHRGRARRASAPRQWHVIECNGHDVDAVDRAIGEAKSSGRPTLIKMKTEIGLGAPNKAGTAGVHGAPLGAEERGAGAAGLCLGLRGFLGAGGPARPSGAPSAAAARTRARHGRAGLPHSTGRRAPSSSAAWRAGCPRGSMPPSPRARADLFAKPQKVATRKASQMALETLTEVCPEMLGGSADLTGSNLTRVKAVDSDFQPDNPAGRYICYGVREFAMCAAMNGISVHGGVIPYGGTFLVFSDYARNAIRLSALMEIGTIFVMTHDSIGLGEDGPTHQPVEHLASLRAIPNLNVFRPADAVETLECWEIAVRSRNTPSLLALSRQGVPQLRPEDDENLSARGAYVIRQFGEGRDLTILATGTEVSLAVEAAEALAADGRAVAVVSMPSWELFEAQPADYRAKVLGDAPRIGVEAAGKFGWTRYVASEDDVIGMTSFGASAPAEVCYEKFGITADAVVARGKALMAEQAS